MNVVEFIEQTLIREIGEIQKDHTYLSFSLISQGIEFLGSLIDKYEFDTPGHSGDRFDNCLLEFFPSSYHLYTRGKIVQFELYNNLRCGLLHIVTPKSPIVLGELLLDGGKHEHLQFCIYHDKKRLFLMAEPFYEDFKLACKTVRAIIEDQSIFVCYPDILEAPLKTETIKLKSPFLHTSQ